MTALREWFHLVTDVGDLHVKRTREATPEERVELARELDILACQELQVSCAIAALGKGHYRFEGVLDAVVTQACVVTLEPVETRLSEPISVEFGPPEAVDAGPPGIDEREVLSIPEVEPIEDGKIDVGTVVFGILSSALPAYPRADGASFDWVDPKATADPEADNPFAALAKLKPRP